VPYVPEIQHCRAHKVTRIAYRLLSNLVGQPNRIALFSVWFVFQFGYSVSAGFYGDAYPMFLSCSYGRDKPKGVTHARTHAHTHAHTHARSTNTHTRTHTHSHLCTQAEAMERKAGLLLGQPVKSKKKGRVE